MERLVGELGRFTQDGVRTYLTLPRTFALPKGIKSGRSTIAIRVWMDPSTALTNPDAGGLHGPPILGQAGPIERMLRLEWDAVNRSQMSSFLELAVLLLAIMVAVLLYWLDRKEKAYLWLVLTCLGVDTADDRNAVGNYTAMCSRAPVLPSHGCCAGSRSDRALDHLLGVLVPAWAACPGCTKWCGVSPLRWQSRLP